MPLLDHFQPPLYPHRSWESFHSRWANSIADAFNRQLPERFFAEVQIHLGSMVEADVAELERAKEEGSNGARGGVALTTWTPGAATTVIPAVFPDDIEVRVRDETDDARLVGVVELASPRNKDRADSRRAFAAKCAAYLQRGVGVLTVDVVTSRHANLHNELIQLMGWDSAATMADTIPLYSVAYQPVRRNEANEIAVWIEPLAIANTLPVMPLALRGYQAVPVDLEATYADACERSRL